MKKLFLIIGLTQSFICVAQKQSQDTFYSYHYNGDTLIQSFTVNQTTTFEKPLIVGKQIGALNAVEVYKNGFYEKIIDSFVPDKLPGGFLTGMNYKKSAIYRLNSNPGGIPTIVNDRTFLNKPEFVPNYFFLISLIGGFLLLIIGYYTIYNKEKISNSTYIFQWLLFVVFLTAMDAMSIYASCIILGLKYFPLIEAILVLIIHLTGSIIVFKMIKKRNVLET